MKALLYRRFEFLLRPVPIIATALFLLANIYYPIKIYSKYEQRRDSWFSSEIFELFGFFIIQFVIMLVMIIWLSMSIIKKDEASKWSIFLNTTPVKKRIYVTEAYIFTFVLIVLFSLICSISWIAIMKINKDFDTKNYIQSLANIGMIPSLIMSTTLPIAFAFGSNKISSGHIKGVGLIFSIWLFAFALLFMLTIIPTLDSLVKAFVAFAFSYGSLLASWIMSLSAYEKREF